MDTGSAAHRVAARAWLGAVEAASLDALRHRGQPGQPPPERLVDLLSGALFALLFAAHRQNPGAVRGDPLAGLPLLAGVLGG